MSILTRKRGQHAHMPGHQTDATFPVVAEVGGVRLLLRARQLRGQMTLVEAARRAGVNRDELSRLERGETTQIRFATIAKLLAAYGCTLDDLVAVERTPDVMPLYSGALAALSDGAVALPGRRRRTVRRDGILDLIAEDEEVSFAADSGDTTRRRRAAVGTTPR